MIPVQLTCEHEPVPTQEGAGFRPVVRLNGEALWRGRPEPSPEEAERVALAYLRYVLSGAMGDPTAADGPFVPPAGEAAPAGPAFGDGDEDDGTPGAALGEAVEAISAEVLDALRRVSDFLEKGDWKRFLR